MFKLLASIGKLISWLRASPPIDEADEPFRFTPELVSQAEQGDAVAQTMLATAYHEGLGVKRDPESAYRWFRAAADQGHAGAAAMVAVSYDLGIVVERDPVLASYWAARSKAAGNQLGDALFVSCVEKLNDDERARLKELLTQSA